MNCRRTFHQTEIFRKRGLLKRSRALTADMEDRLGPFRTSLRSLPEYESATLVNELVDDTRTNGEDARAFPSLPDRLLKRMGLYGVFVEGNKNLNEPDIEERYARLSLAFKTDKFTLGKRLDLQLRQRDIAEKNIDSELRALRESLNALNQLCTESDMREIITKTQQHVDIVQQATMRMSSRAETYGAIQQEQRMNCAFETMLNYVEHLKLVYDKEHLELEEYRRLLASHNLLPHDDKNASTLDDDPKRVLPPRSQSLSCSNKPEVWRRGSVGTVGIRSTAIDSVVRENTGWSLSGMRQKLECRTRLLSAVCLLNNNFESSSSSPRSTPGSTAAPLSPKSRRCSLPVGPLHHPATRPPHPTTISEKAHPAERRDSQAKAIRESHLTRTESEESTSSKPESDAPGPLQEQPDEDNGGPPATLKDSSEVALPPPYPLASDAEEDETSLPCSVQESACDNESDLVCLLPEIIVPVKYKPFHVLNFIRKVSIRRMWRWDNNAAVLLHARYALSAILAAAAMLTFVLTFIPNLVLAFT